MRRFRAPLSCVDVVPRRRPSSTEWDGCRIARRFACRPPERRRILHSCDPLNGASRSPCSTGSSPSWRPFASRTARPRSRRSPWPPASRSPPSRDSSATSCAQRYLTRSEDGVGIGLRLFELGARTSTPRRLSAAALPVLAELFNATGEHLNVAVQRRTRHALGDLGAGPAATGAVAGGGARALGDDGPRQGGPGVHGATSRCSAASRPASTPTPVARSSGSSPACAPRRSPSTAARRSPASSASRAPSSPRSAVPVAAISVAGPVADMDPNRMVPLVRRAALALTHRLASQVA